MSQRKSPEKLSKFISYILGHKPDEFGLVPDPNGFVKIKELLKAICEEDGWKYVRRSYIDEILITLQKPPIEIKDNYIRAKCRDKLQKQTLVQNPPKLLYSCVRRKAYPFLITKGISPLGHQHVILSATLEMAERIGKRIDQMPVILTVNTQKAQDRGVEFYQTGGSIFLAEFIPQGCFTGPPLPKEKPEEKKRRDDLEQITQKTPGSFFYDLVDKKEYRDHTKQERRRKERIWKKERKRAQKKSRKFSPK